MEIICINIIIIFYNACIEITIGDGVHIWILDEDDSTTKSVNMNVNMNTNMNTNTNINTNKDKSDQSIELSSLDNSGLNFDENKFHDSSNQNSYETLRSSLMLRKKKRRIGRIEKLFFHLPKH